MSVSLAVLGWTTDRAEEFAPFAAEGLVPGRITLEHNHVYRVNTGGEERLAEAAGRMKHRAGSPHELPSVGDWVALRVGPAGTRSQIRAVLRRKSAFVRKAAGREGRETEPQVVAANVDLVCVVFGLDSPVNPRSIDRYLVVARHSGAEALVVLNKADLAPDVAEAVAVATAAAGQTPVAAISSRTGEGMDAVEQRMAAGRTAAFIGPSGAGKSTIVNRLVGRDVLPTGEVRDWDARGRHTSVHRQLVVRDRGGLIIDTPGMRELQLWDVDAVAATFDDVAALAGQCRFRDCRHESEPGCAVQAAAADGRLDPARLDSYLTLQREQEAVDRQREQRALIEEKRQAKSRQRALRSLYRNRGRR